MWSLEGSTARWHAESLQLHVDVKHPELGLQAISWRGRALSAFQLLRVVALTDGGQGSALEDVYVRGRDVVATYGQTACSPLRTQVYWRVSQLPDVDGAVVLEAIVSAQTQLLDSDPRVEISSVLAGRDWHLLRGPAEYGDGESLAIDPQRACRLDVPPEGVAVFLRTPDGACTYGQLIPQTDWVDSRIVWDPARAATTLTVVYFAARLEKGVLRRTRIAALLVPRDRDIDHLRAYWSASQCAAPPLTT